MQSQSKANGKPRELARASSKPCAHDLKNKRFNFSFCPIAMAIYKWPAVFNSVSPLYTHRNCIWMNKVGTVCYRTRWFCAVVCSNRCTQVVQKQHYPTVIRPQTRGHPEIRAMVVRTKAFAKSRPNQAKENKRNVLFICLAWCAEGIALPPVQTLYGE